MRTNNNYLATIAFALGLYCGYYFIKSDKIDNNTLQTCFTPGENCTKLITDTIDQSKETIYVQSYSFTSVPISQALNRAANRGVKVSIILDRSNKEKTIDAIELVKNNPLIDIKIDALPGIAHNKVMIIDESVITGSFNFTNAAQTRNAENVIKIANEKTRNRYKANWDSRYAKSYAFTDLINMPKQTFYKKATESKARDMRQEKSGVRNTQNPLAAKQMFYKKADEGRTREKSGIRNAQNPLAAKQMFYKKADESKARDMRQEKSDVKTSRYNDYR